MIDEEIIYYKSKSQTQFKDCVRGFHATTKVGTLKEYTFSESVAAYHNFGSTVVNLNNLLPLFLLQRFRDQFAEAFPSKFAPQIQQSTVTKRLKDFYAAKGTSRSFKYLMRVLFGVESVIEYPKDRIFKPSERILHCKGDYSCYSDKRKPCRTYRTSIIPRERSKRPKCKFRTYIRKIRS